MCGQTFTSIFCHQQVILDISRMDIDTKEITANYDQKASLGLLVAHTVGAGPRPSVHSDKSPKVHPPSISCHGYSRLVC